MKRILRIHGDNILECESALHFLGDAFEIPPERIIFTKSPPYAPIYEFSPDKETTFVVQLFPGHGRWGINIQKYLLKKGAPLREATDAIVTELIETKDGREERPLFSMEFCGALPAGNNAWQRCGRALAMAYTKIPYFYLAEIGGLELGEGRSVIAPRFPNPLVPFAYMILGAVEKTVAVPVFAPSPTISPKVQVEFKDCFGIEEARMLVKEIVLKKVHPATFASLEERAKNVIGVLASKRRRGDVLNPEEWNELASFDDGLAIANWLVRRKMGWRKRIGMSSITPSFKRLLRAVIASGAVAVGSADMPLCLVEQVKRRDLSEVIERLYPGRLSDDFLKWLAGSSRPLLIVWIAGFKPHGDDSRPDRGLLPLARMIFGREGVDVLTVVYGPAAPATWVVMQKDIYRLSSTNGLWEAVLGLSDAVLCDTKTNKRMGNIGLVMPQEKSEQSSEVLPACSTTPVFGEHDVDSTLHLLFSEANSQGVYEGMCNPPGGDWSGISLIDFTEGSEYRWTSLPRVSGESSKRPDHLVQFRFNDSLVSVESKDEASTLEEGVGDRLKRYVADLIQLPPTIIRKDGKTKQTERVTRLPFSPTIISGAAIRFTGEDSLKLALSRGGVDIVLAVEFVPEEGRVRLHVLITDITKGFIAEIKKLATRFGASVEIIVEK